MPSPPLLADAAPALAAALAAALRSSGRPELAATVPGLAATARCGCGEDFCQSVHTGPGRVARTLQAGDYIVDLDEQGRIVYVEVLYAEPVLGLESLPAQRAART